ncbi:MAG TPA: copper resistance CopC family protein [Ktedonobacterales bacterium]|nr:copper resistance CopC family protein [Ktedonobacterales bacterium]
MTDRMGADRVYHWAPQNGGARCGAGLLALGAGLLALLLALAPTELVAAAPATLAHARYQSSVPAANAILKTAPTVVTVHFAENVNPVGSDLVVYDANGKPVSAAAAQVDRADLKTMTVPMKADGSEIYLVEWHTVSADDGDPDIGGFNFLVNPSASSVQAVQAANGGASPTTTVGSSSSGAPVWLVVVIGLLGLVIGGGGLFFAQRQGWAPAVAPANAPTRRNPPL